LYETFSTKKLPIIKREIDKSSTNKKSKFNKILSNNSVLNSGESNNDGSNVRVSIPLNNNQELSEIKEIN